MQNTFTLQIRIPDELRTVLEKDAQERNKKPSSLARLLLLKHYKLNKL